MFNVATTTLSLVNSYCIACGVEIDKPRKEISELWSVMLWKGDHELSNKLSHCYI